MADDKRLIEDYLPVDALNAIAAKEKKHPKHQAALVHYWPARRPLSVSRAAIYAALVPAPKTESERERASKFLAKLAAYDVAISEVAEAVAQIRGFHAGRTPKVLDVFSGGGAIPLEAARLGCEAHAVEYNPVAHLIELCTLVYPQQFGSGLADEVDRWGKRVLASLKKATGDLYPLVTVPGKGAMKEQNDLFGDSIENTSAGAKCIPVSYIWVRTVPCRKPGCGCEVPLVRRAWLRKKGVYVAAVPTSKGKDKTVEWEIVAGQTVQDVGSENEDQTGAGESACPKCTTPVASDYVKECSVTGRMKEVLAAVVVDGGRSKLYLPPQASTQPNAADCAQRLTDTLTKHGLQPLEERMNTRDSTTVAGRGYGIERWAQLFTARQLLVLVTLVGCIRDAHREMLQQGQKPDRAKAVTTFLAMAFGRLANSFTKFCRWQGQDQKTIAAIGDRQALKMVYDFSEINPFAETAGCLPMAFENEVFCIRKLSQIKSVAIATRGNAEGLLYDDATFDAVVTDPPYYSSIFYSDLSNFFYVWLRRIVGDLYPEHFASITPPKKREAVAQASEHGGDNEKAEEHYRAMMLKAFTEIRRVLKPGAPLVCVYAHKTTEGWASLINALVPAGLTVTEAWPLQTEAKGRTNALEAAALSDSIFLVARKRGSDKTGSYEDLVRPELEAVARERIRTLWRGGKGIGGADLLMAAVGAGLRPYTQFARVEYLNGDQVPPERYLQEVEGVVLDTMLEEIFGLTRSGVSAVDVLSRFYILWRFTYRESSIESGDAFVFCYPQGIELDGPGGISGPAPALVEKSRTIYRVRTFLERGADEDLGLPEEDGTPASLIDVLHRVLWLMEKRPTQLAEFLNEAQPNREQLRLVAQALAGPALKGSDLEGASPTPELSALAKLTANWQSVVEGALVSDVEQADRRKGQERLL
ncbi:MAG: DUF1156 domain-containing protein [Verrucomicrobiia bacterium]